VGEYLLGLYLLLEPYASGPALTNLHPELRTGAPASEGQAAAADLELEPERRHVILWMKAIAQRTTVLLLDAVSGIPALSPLGAKQLAADVAYLSNIFSVGLSLPQHGALTELEALLTCDMSVVTATAKQVAALPRELAMAVAAKRGAAAL
jgi:hypothetical protein